MFHPRLSSPTRLRTDVSLYAGLYAWLTCIALQTYWKPMGAGQPVSVDCRMNDLLA